MTLSETHQLIKKLERNEKGYFKKNLLLYEAEKESVELLFNLLDAQEVLNEKKIIEKFSILSNQQTKIETVKNELTNFLLHFLFSYHADKDDTNTMYSLYIDGLTLVDRKLYKQAFKKLISAKNLAKKNRIPLLILEINGAIMSIIEYLDKEKMIETTLLYLEENKTIIEKLRT